MRNHRNNPANLSPTLSSTKTSFRQSNISYASATKNASKSHNQGNVPIFNDLVSYFKLAEDLAPEYNKLKSQHERQALLLQTVLNFTLNKDNDK